MSATFATGKIAWGWCDRCGQRQYLKELTDQVVDRKKTGLLVCSVCLDIDHPQLQLGKTPIYDPQALRNPRPDKRTDVTNNAVFTGSYTSYGAPIFTTQVTPLADDLAAAGAVSTTRRN